MKKILAKIICAAMVISAFVPAICVQATQNTETVTIPVAAVAAIQTDYSSGANTTYSSETVGDMDEGKSLNSYRLRNHSLITTSPYSYRRLFVRFDLSNAIKKGNIDACTLDFNFKNTNSNAGTLNVYEADGISFSDSSDFVEKYSNWSAVENLLNVTPIVSYKKVTADKNGNRKNFDVISYIQSRIKEGYTTATVMLDYLCPSKGTNAYVAFISSDTASKPLELTATVSYETEAAITPVAYAPFNQDITTGALSGVKVSGAGNMGSSSNPQTLYTMPLINHNYYKISSYRKAAVKFSIPDKDVASAILTLNMKFQGSPAGTLHIDGISDAGAYTTATNSVASDFTGTYTNWSELSPKVVTPVKTYRRAYGVANEYATDIDIDITDYVAQVARSGKTEVDLLFEYYSDDDESTVTGQANTVRTAYICTEGAYVPKLALVTKAKTDYTITNATSDANGTVFVQASAKAAETVDITVTPNGGYEVDTVTVTDIDSGSVITTADNNGIYSFVMPSSGVSVAATFKAIQAENAIDWEIGAFYGRVEEEDETKTLRFMARPTTQSGYEFATSNYGFVFTNFGEWEASPDNPYDESYDLPSNIANSVRTVNVAGANTYLQSGGTFYYDITGIDTQTHYLVNMYAVPYVLRDSKIIAWGTPFTYTDNSGYLN